jgi:hypothetical protein
MTYQLKAPAVIDASMAAVEYWYTKLGADEFAKMMAARLRDPLPRREVLDAVARLLDPQPKDQLRLVLKRRNRAPKMRWTKRREDIDIAIEVEQFQMEWLLAGKPKRGSRKKAVGVVAKKRGIGSDKVQQALRVLSLIPR